MTDKHKAYAKTGTADDQMFGVGANRFHPLQKKSTKLSKICENKNGKEQKRVVCSRDIKQMNIGSLAD